MTLEFHLRINQGETFQLAVPVLDPNGSNVNLSGMTARGQIRTHAASPTVLYEWSTGANNLAFSGNDVVITVPAATSSAWTWRTAQYDLELVDGSGNVTRLVEGHVIVHPEITR
jgi:hypothetical protein